MLALPTFKGFIEAYWFVHYTKTDIVRNESHIFSILTIEWNMILR